MGMPIASRTPLPRSRSIGAKRPARVDLQEQEVQEVQEGSRVRIVSAEGRDGVLRFVLRRVVGGLYVEREELPRKGTRTSISVEFTDRDGFERWHEDDLSRFEHPLLHQRVRRDAEQLWKFNG
jgi:hypothetical protein